MKRRLTFMFGRDKKQDTQPEVETVEEILNDTPETKEGIEKAYNERINVVKLKAREKAMYNVGKEAYEEFVPEVSEKDLAEGKSPKMLDDSQIVFEYYYLGNMVTVPETEESFEVELTDMAQFIAGWDTAEEERDLINDLEEDLLGVNDDEEDDFSDLSPYQQWIAKRFGRDYVTGGGNKYVVSKGSYSSSAYQYPYKSTTPYVTPDPNPRLYDRFDYIADSKKVITFGLEMSKLFDDVFARARGKEVMFFSELTQSESDPNAFSVASMNFPPQKNYGAYVETRDGEFEQWLVQNIVFKGKKVPLHVHTHPDFSAFSSGTDEIQIKKFIQDNEGNPFVVQLVVSNPRKGTYYIRWFDLVNNTYERPLVEFTFDRINVDEQFSGIFQFEAVRDLGSLQPISRTLWDDEDIPTSVGNKDDEDLDISDIDDFNKAYAKSLRKIK